MEKVHTPEAETITSADVESTADCPAALTANLFFCSLCKSVYRQAKILPCLHSFCRPCLVGLVSHGPGGSFIHCPSCQFRAPLPPSGVVGVPDNSFLNRLCQDYAREIKDKMKETPATPTQTFSPTRPSARVLKEKNDTSARRGQHASRGQSRDTVLQEDDNDIEEDVEECKGPQDPFASERAAPSEIGNNESTLVAIHNRNRLQAKVMGLQGEALRLTYAIDQINSWPEEWRLKREDLKRQVRAHSSQLQFIVKRAERALLAKIDEAGREADHKFMRAAEVGKQRLRDSLRNVLHEVNVLKGVRELGMDEEVNTMCAFLLGRSVGMEEVSLDMPSVALEGLGQKESDIQDIVTKSFGNLAFSERQTDVFKPEPIDFFRVSVENIVNKANLSEKSSSNITSEELSTTSTDAGSLEDSAGERRSRKRSTADKRRHKTDLGLDSPDVRDYLTQFQTARETFRARRLEILQQGQMGRVAAASPARGSEMGEWGLDAIRTRLRSSSREGGRIRSVDRAHLSTMPTGFSVSETPNFMGRRGSAPISRSSSMSRVTTIGQTAGPPSAVASKYLSIGAVEKPPPSPVREEPGSPHEKVLKDREATSDADFYHSLLSPQVQRRHVSRERRHSLESVPALENISIPAAAELLTQAETGDGGSSRPIRRAISSAADKRAKIEILRETWHRRKEVLIQNEGFVTLDSSGSPRHGSECSASPRQGHPPPISSKSTQGTSGPVKQEKTKFLLTENQPNVEKIGDILDSARPTTKTGSIEQMLAKPVISQSPIIHSATSTSFSSEGGPAAHLVNTVKISIPEVSERVSPTPDRVKITTDQPEDSNKRLTTTEAESTICAKPIDENVASNEVLILTKSNSSTSSDSGQLEETTENVKTETFTVAIPVSLSQTSTSTISLEKTTASTPLKTQESSPKPTVQAAPTYFFRSRLTGLPVGGSGSSLNPPSGPPKPTHFFTSRITGLPVGGPIAPTATSTSSSKPSASIMSKMPSSTTLTPISTTDNADKTSKTPLVDTHSATLNTVVSSRAEPTVSVTTPSMFILDGSALIVQTSPVVILPTAAAIITTSASTIEAHAAEPKASSVLNPKHASNTSFVYTSKRTGSVTSGDDTIDDTELPIKVTLIQTTNLANSSMIDQKSTIVVPTTASNLESEKKNQVISVTSSNELTVRSTMPFFKSRLTGMPVGGSPLSSNMSMPANVSTTTPASSTTFFTSRLTGEPVGRETFNIRKTQEVGTKGDPGAMSSETSSNFADSTTRYPSRYNVESRYKPRETVDVASLIAAMYRGNERNIIDTHSPTRSEDQLKSTGPVVTRLVPGETTTTTMSTTTVASDTEDKSKLKRELPPLRSAPAFSYVRRYNLSSSSSPSQHSTAISSENILSRDSAKREEVVPGPVMAKICEISPIITKTLQTSSVTPETSLGGKYSQDTNATKAYEQTPSSYTIKSMSSNSVEQNNLLGQSSIDKGPLAILNTVSSGATTTLPSQKLDYPRAHLPDVIPEATLKIASSEENIASEPEETKVDAHVTTDWEAKATNVSNILKKTEARETVPLEVAKSSQEVKKSFGFDVDSEISRGISITDAIRRSSSPLMPRRSPAPVRRSGVPEPLDLKEGAVARSPTGTVETKEVSSPDTNSPLQSPSSPNPAERGIKGRLKEIARKKKERWRHLTIH